MSSLLERVPTLKVRNTVPREAEKKEHMNTHKSKKQWI